MDEDLRAFSRDYPCVALNSPALELATLDRECAGRSLLDQAHMANVACHARPLQPIAPSLA
jgi:hypothetical protein